MWWGNKIGEYRYLSPPANMSWSTWWNSGGGGVVVVVVVVVVERMGGGISDPRSKMTTGGAPHTKQHENADHQREPRVPGGSQ